MTKRAQFGLTFSKIKMSGFSDSFICGGSNSINGSLQLANWLDTISDREPEGFLEEINLALSGEDFTDIYRPDGSSVDKVEIKPPNAIINESFTIPLVDLKALMEEWIVYINNH